MANLTASSLFVLGNFDETFGDPVSITNSWADRLAGTAFVGGTAMEGFVIALSMDGPTLVGVSDIAIDGTWEITNIAEQYATKKLVVLGLPFDETVNVAIASRVLPV